MTEKSSAIPLPHETAYGEPQPGETSIKRVRIESRRGPVDWRQLEIPVFSGRFDEANNPTGSALTIIRALTRRIPLPQNAESNQNQTRYAMVFLGGGSSEALGNAPFAADIEQALVDAHSDAEFGPVVDQMVVLSHISGSPRTSKPDRDQRRNDRLLLRTPDNSYDPSKEAANFTEPARILKQALDNPEIKKDMGKRRQILMGYSAGGAQMIELAAQLDESVVALVLLDAAGLSDHPNLPMEFTLGSWRATIKKYRSQRDPIDLAENLTFEEKVYRKISRPFRVAQNFANETTQTWVTPDGHTSFVDIALDVLKPKRWVKQVGSQMGINEAAMAKTGPNIEALMHESTLQAREKITAPVIIAPVMLAKVVNVMIDKLAIPYEELKQAQTDEKKKQQMNARIQSQIKQLFPNAPVVFAPIEGITHGTVMMEPDTYMTDLMKKVLELVTDKSDTQS